ncbi:BapA prefix-like domain-containing protein, partial [Acinetobacter sp. YH12039]|uniref:BapA/Bap/LapF family prefix-like domain-containing protein n=1 Tax=Acinetobacter sp. YH12039 TaxID=2601047 RepID=UPI0015D13CAB
MPSIKIVAKEGHEVLSQTTDKNSVALTEASVVTLGVAKADISEIQRNGADVVIRLKSGEVIVIQNFYSTTTATDNSLVLEDGNQLLWVKLTDETGAFLAEVVYEPLTTIEPLLYSEGVPLWAWAAGAVAVGGLAAGLSGGGSDGGNGGGDQGPSAAYKAATAAVDKAVEAYQDAKDALTAANTDGLINPTEKAALEKAKTDAEAAKAAAQAKVDALPSTEQAAKDALDARLDKLTDPVITVNVNDADSNGVLDNVDAAIAAAKAAVAAAEAKHTALKDAITAKGGVINPQDKADLDAIKLELDGLKGTAQDLVTNLPASADKTALQGKLDALNTTVPNVNDADSNGVLDNVDAAIAAAKAAVAAAEAKHTALKDAITAK